MLCLSHAPQSSRTTNHVGSVELEIDQQLNIGDEEEERFFDLKMLDENEIKLPENEIKDLD